MEEKELNLQEIQQEALKVLLKFDSLCKEYNWTYCITYGTLLGAIRHNGFIPWDDDIDVFMPRVDFDKFCEWCENNEENIKPFKLCNWKTVKNYPFGLPRFSNMEYRYVTTEKGFKDFDIGVFIDIYPLDNYGNSYSEGCTLVDKLLKQNWKRFIYFNNYDKNFFKRIIKTLIHLFLKIVAPKNYSTILSNKIRDEILTHTSNDNKFVGCPSWTSGCYQFNKKWFEKFEIHKFENYSFYIPSGYKEFLSSMYGNYMELPPEDKRQPYHEYKIFRRNSLSETL